MEELPLLPGHRFSDVTVRSLNPSGETRVDRLTFSEPTS